MTFPPFSFDGNQWFGCVDSDARWCELVAAYQGDVARVLGATTAPRTEPAALPASDSGEARVQDDDPERFSFRHDPRGAVTLAAWSRARGYDLAAAFARRTRT